MRINCPSCGKEHEAPESEGHRLIQCSCKNLFRASDAAKNAGPKSIDPSTIVLETKKGFYLDEDEPSEVETSISEGDLDQFLSTLKKNKEEISSGDAEGRPVPKSIRSLHEQIELGEVKAEKKQKREVETAVSATPTASAIMDEPSVTASKLNRKTTPPAPTPPTFWQKIEMMSVTQKSVLGSLAALPFVVAIGYLAFHEEPKPEIKVDPSISKLLIPRAEEPKPEPKAAEQIQPRTAEAKPKVPAEAPVEQPRFYAQMKKSTLEGDFENVIRIGAVNRAQLRLSELALFFEAQLIRAAKDGERVQEIRMEIEKIGGQDMDSVLRRAHALSMLRDPAFKDALPKVLQVFKSLSLTRADDPLVYAYLGMTHEKLEHEEAAQAAWDQALTLEPRMAWLLERREQIFRARKDYKNATDMARRLTRIDGFEAHGYELMYELSKLQNDDASAIKNLRMALKEKESLNLRMLIAKELDDTPKEAIKELQAALITAEDAKNKAEIYSQIGRQLCNLKDYNSGFATFKKAIKEKKDFAGAYFERGVCERRAGTNKKASESFALALKYNPQDYRAWYHYGITLGLDNKTKAAISAFTRSTQIQPTDAAHLQIAQILLKERKRKEALAHARKAYSLNPKNQKARNLVAELQR